MASGAECLFAALRLSEPTGMPLGSFSYEKLIGIKVTIIRRRVF